MLSVVCPDGVAAVAVAAVDGAAGIYDTLNVFINTYFWELQPEQIRWLGLCGAPSAMAGSLCVPWLMRRYDRKPVRPNGEASMLLIRGGLFGLLACWLLGRLASWLLVACSSVLASQSQHTYLLFCRSTTECLRRRSQK